MDIQFEWDENKNRANHRNQADYEKVEDRYILLGMSFSLRVLVVIYCERKSGKVLRIISARKATRNEIKSYEKGI